MSKNSLLQDQADRINPEFKGIAQKYTKIKKERIEIDRKKYSLEAKLNYHERTKDSLDSKLKTKKDELKWLKSVRERHLTDIRYRMEKQQLDSQRLEQLRLQSQNSRKTSHANIFNAILNSKHEKLKTTMEVKRQLSEIKRLKRIQQEQIELLNAFRSKQLRQQKSLSRSKVNQFYRRKNKILLNSYQEMIKNQQKNTQKSQKQISFIQTQANLMDQKVKKKKQKLKSIEDQINKLRAEATESRVSNIHTIDYSRMTKRSSKPYDILLKQSYATQFPSKNNKEILQSI